MMTKRFFFAASAAMMLVACTQKLISDIQEQSSIKDGGAIITATINDEPATRVVIDQESVNGRTILKWEDGDRVLLASGQRGYTFKGNFSATQTDGHFTLFQEENGSTGTFDARKVNEAYYPASAWDYSGPDPVFTFRAEQVYSKGTFDRWAMPMVASSSNGYFVFSVEAAVLRINVSTQMEDVTLDCITLSSNNHNLSGNAVLSYTDFLSPSVGELSNSISLFCGNAEIDATAKPFYIVIPAGIYDLGDLTLTFNANTGIDEKISNKAFTLEVGNVYDMNLNIAPTKEPLNLSAEGTANCYIVSEYGRCKFDATMKGNSTWDSVGTIASAEVLWESFGTDVQPEIGDVVRGVSVKDGFVNFTASGRDGNAVIAVKDASGTILWSWHIWVCKGFDPAATAHVYYNNAGTMMDRNLGALSNSMGDVKSLGLLYQWGRKDPFLGGSTINRPKNTPLSKASSTLLDWPNPVASTEETGREKYAFEHPTTFIKRNEKNYDWIYSGHSGTSTNRWNYKKTEVDPCPRGWKVPIGGNYGIWAKAFGSSSFFNDTFDSDNYGINFKYKLANSNSVWYPAAGYISETSGGLTEVGNYGYYSSYAAGYANGYNFVDLFYFHNGGYVHPGIARGLANGSSVRCVKE